MMQDVVHEIEQLAKSVLDQMHTVLPCRVTKVNTTDCTVSVLPYGRLKISDKIKLEFPEISEVPIVNLSRQSSDVGIFMPVKVGDEGLLIITESGLDSWRSSGKQQESLRYDLTNGVFLPGIIRKSAMLKEAIESDSMIVTYGENKITLSESTVTIGGNLMVDGDIFYTGNITKA